MPLDEPGSQEFLKNFAENQIDDDIGNFIRDFESQSRLFSIPRLGIFDENDINHRKGDLFFGGIPYTSEKWPWPLDSKGCRLYPIAQIDLENAGDLLQLNLGAGKLQVWGEFRNKCYKGFEKNYDNNIDSEDWRLRFSDEFKLIFRTIPSGDLLDEICQEKSLGNATVADKLFAKYSKSLRMHEGNNLIDWQSPGEMYYPSFQKFYYFGELDHKTKKNHKVTVSDVYEMLEDEFYRELDSELNDADVMTSNRLWNKIGPKCSLGGYPPALDHNSISYDSNILLFFRCMGGDFAITFDRNRKGDLQFSLESHYDDVD